jgi:UDP-N-acetylmuramate--alanine ligase
MTRIHLIGVGGTGLSAIARVLLEMGHAVSGSDRVESPYTRDLQSAGVAIQIGHRPENVSAADLVVRSSAIPDDNPEVIAARAAGIPVLKRADFLASLMEGKTCIAVAGTHGKTTTSAMIAWILAALNRDPSFIVGSVLANLRTNAHYGQGSAFVIEADEYDRMFLGLQPAIEVVTNLEHDHPDCYPTLADLQAAFLEFVQHLASGGTLIACSEDPGASNLLAQAERIGKAALAYALEPSTSRWGTAGIFTTSHSVNEKGGFNFTASILGTPVSVELQVPGRHNILNALAALTVAKQLDLPLPEAAQALGKFTGTGRRFEVRGEVNGITIIDDYAHHPTEIKATLAAARARYTHSTIWAVWQPHTYSRTQMLLDEFASSFQDADEVIVTEVYPAREPPQAFSSRAVIEAMPRRAHFIASLPGVTDYLLNHLRPGDVLLVLSAGDADQISSALLASLREVHYG